MTSVIQTKVGTWHAGGSGAFSETFTNPLTTGTNLYAWLWGATTDVIDTAGWTKVFNLSGLAELGQISFWEASPSAGASVNVPVGPTGTARSLTLIEAIGAVDVTAYRQGTAPSGGSGTLTGPAILPTVNSGILLVGVHAANQSYAGPATFTAVAPLTADAAATEYSRVHKWTARRTTALVSVTPSVTVSGLTGNYPYAVLAVVIAVPPSMAPVADFNRSDTDIAPGGSITFTDTSTNTPTSWAWTFGDGGTSTSQNPSHVYATAGTFSVTLTATNASGSDSETKTITVTAPSSYETPTPAGVLLEIYAASPGSSRWGIAKWGQGKWSSAGWQDVTPYGVTVGITWGSSRPELGILSTPEAASWTVRYYDPDRILDPANVESPYYGDLIPFLPIRVSHRGVVVRVGFATGISHRFSDDTGYMRGADNITRLANAQVPSDTPLADTLYARTVDAIAAAGLTMTVAEPPGGTDPAVSPWLTGTREWSAWQWILDAAQETLRIPIIDRLGVVTFRAWDSPLYRARSVNSPELIDLEDVTDYSGLYSVVRARLDDDTFSERALVPPPRYGARTFSRDEITIDPDAWAEAVLADRTFPVLRWVPGEIYPLTALSVERLATIEAVEQITMAVGEEDPPVAVTGVVVGGEITVFGKYNDEARWRFVYHVAASAETPIIESGGDDTDYVLSTGGDEFVYPTA